MICAVSMSEARYSSSAGGGNSVEIAEWNHVHLTTFAPSNSRSIALYYASGRHSLGDGRDDFVLCLMTGGRGSGFGGR
jgi:hypothetical protein